MLRQIYELTPLITALYVVYLVFTSNRNNVNKYKVVLSGTIYLSVALLFIAQTSWIMSVISQSFVGTFLADIIWTLFDLLVMIVFILFLYPYRNRRKDDQND